jgi:hypothetical protein
MGNGASIPGYLDGDFKVERGFSPFDRLAHDRVGKPVAFVWRGTLLSELPK